MKVITGCKDGTVTICINRSPSPAHLDPSPSNLYPNVTSKSIDRPGMSLTQQLRKTSACMTAVLSGRNATLSQSDKEKEIPFVLPTYSKGGIRNLTTSDRAGSESHLVVNNARLGTPSRKLSSSTGLSGNQQPSSSTGVNSMQDINDAIRSSSLGSLNPDLYKDPSEGELLEYPEGNRGRLWFTIDFDRRNELLNVTIEKVRNLPSRDKHNNSCDPFVRMVILPDEKKLLETKPKKKTVNPDFKETFQVKMKSDKFEGHALKFTIIDVDSGKKHTPLGTVTFNLRDYSLCKSAKLTLWRDISTLKDDETSGQLGTVRIALNYNNDIERLQLTVIQASDLRSTNGEACDTYSRVSIAQGTKMCKVKKSKIMKKSLKPLFNELFEFKITRPTLETTSVNIQIMQVKPERQLGQVTLGGYLVAEAKAAEHWTTMHQKPKCTITEWHDLND